MSQVKNAQKNEQRGFHFPYKTDEGKGKRRGQHENPERFCKRRGKRRAVSVRFDKDDFKNVPEVNQGRRQQDKQGVFFENPQKIERLR